MRVVERADTAPLTGGATDREKGRPMAAEIDPALLAQFPNGPYAVYSYNPKVGREYVCRNLGPDDAVKMAEADAAKGFRVHVSLDTCG